MKFIYLILFFIVSSEMLFGQTKEIKSEQKASVQVIARSFGDSIVLRWAVNTPMGWKLSNKDGFIVERYTLVKEGKLDKKNAPQKLVLTAEPVKPFPLERWENIAKSDKYGAIAAQSIYGKSFEVNTKNNAMMQAVSLAQELESRFSFALFSADQSLKVAEACGLKLTDRNVKKGEKYVYKVYSKVPFKTYAIDTGFVFIGTDENNPLPKPIEVKAEFADRAVMLSWNKVYYEHLFTTYFIERSADDGKTFIRTDDLPIVNTSPAKEGNAKKIYKVDSLPENNKRYIFRVRGITPFEEVSPPSDTVQGMGKAASLKLMPTITSVKNMKDGKSLEIKWRFPQEYNLKIKEFELLRSNKANGEYNSVAKFENSKREFVDSKAERVNYYIIRLTETNGNTTSSFPALGQLIDSIPPMAPLGIIGKIDSTGLLTLQWSKGKEDDIAGYKVYMANSEKEEFTQVTKEPVRDTVFTGKVNINTLTANVYYKVMASDLNYNLSRFSKTVIIKRPDIIPPVSPLLESYKASDTAIYLKWINSSSDDVIKHIVYRRDKQTINWDSIAVFTNGSTEYFDRKATRGKSYEYTIVALDDARLESPKKQIVTLSLVDFGFRPEIKEIKVVIDRLKKQVELKWTYPNQQPEFFMIYRAKKGERLSLFKSIDGKASSFTDKNLQMNTSYVYRVKARFPDSGESPFSKEIEIQY